MCGGGVGGGLHHLSQTGALGISNSADTCDTRRGLSKRPSPAVPRAPSSSAWGGEQLVSPHCDGH